MKPTLPFNKHHNSYENVPPYNCVVCGKEETAHYFDNKSMVENKLCFTCQFWTEYVAKEKNSIRIDGNHYMVGSATTPHRYNGFGGRKFRIRKNDGTVIETCDLWSQGPISEHFRDKLPDNAEFEKIDGPVGHGQGFLGDVP